MKKIDNSRVDAEVANIINKSTKFKQNNIPNDIIKVCNQCNKHIVNHILYQTSTENKFFHEEYLTRNLQGNIESLNLHEKNLPTYNHNQFYHEINKCKVGNLQNQNYNCGLLQNKIEDGYFDGQNNTNNPNKSEPKIKRKSSSIKVMTNRKRGNNMEISEFNKIYLIQNIEVAEKNSSSTNIKYIKRNNYKKYHSIKNEMPKEVNYYKQVHRKNRFENLGEYVKQICTYGNLEELQLLANNIVSQQCLWIPKEKLTQLLNQNTQNHLDTNILFRPVSVTASPSSSSTSSSSDTVNSPSVLNLNYNSHYNNTLHNNRNNLQNIKLNTNFQVFENMKTCVCNTQKIHPEYIDFKKGNDKPETTCHSVSLLNIALDESNQTVLTWSVYHGRRDFVSYLIKLYSKLGYFNNLSKNSSISMNPIDFTTINKENALSFACARGFFEIVLILLTLKQGYANPNPEVDYNGGTPLLYAIQKAFPEIVKSLIDFGAQVTNCGDYDAFELAFELKHFACAAVIKHCLISGCEEYLVQNVVS